jgi:hypothetical protein
VAYTILYFYCAHDLARLERRHAQSTSRHAAKVWGEGTPTNPKSSDEKEKEGEITRAPLSPLCISPLPFSDIISQQVGTTAGEHRLK